MKKTRSGIKLTTGYLTCKSFCCNWLSRTSRKSLSSCMSLRLRLSINTRPISDNLTERSKCMYYNVRHKMLLIKQIPLVPCRMETYRTKNPRYRPDLKTLAWRSSPAMPATSCSPSDIYLTWYEEAEQHFHTEILKKSLKMSLLYICLYYSQPTQKLRRKSNALLKLTRRDCENGC